MSNALQLWPITISAPSNNFHSSLTRRSSLSLLKSTHPLTKIFFPNHLAARSASVQALTPTIGGAKDVLSQAKDLITQYTQIQEKQRDDARAIFTSALGAGSQAVRGLLEQQPDLLKLAGLNPETAKFFIQSKEAEEARKTKDGLTDYQKTQTFNTIVDKYQKSPLIEASDRASATANLIGMLEKNPGARENQLIAIYQFIQILDNYQSAVREGEIGLLTGASSLREKIETSIKKLNKGQSVNPSIVLDITRGLKSLVGSINTSAQKKAQSFRAQAEVAGVGSEFENYLGQFTPSYQQQQRETVQKGGRTFEVNP